MNIDTSQRRTIVISNRIPHSVNVDTEKDIVKVERGSGGLVSALFSLKDVTYFGVVSLNDGEKRNKATLESAYRKVNSIPMFVEENLYKSYYNDFSNSILWPVFHFQKIPFDLFENYSELYNSYKEVNRKMSDFVYNYLKLEQTTITNINDSKPIEFVIWIHDYHFLLLPNLLKRKFCDEKVKIGFYLHIPFPSYENFRDLPKNKEIIRNLLEADLIGFHIKSYRENFIRYCKNVFESDLIKINDLINRMQGEKNHFLNLKKYLESKTIICPAGIDSTRFKPLLSDKKESKENLFRFLGIDRRDTIKGIPNKLMIYKEFHKKFPKIAKCTELYQILIPSRTEVKKVKSLFEKVKTMVKSINEDFGNENYKPVKLINSSVSFDDLVNLYRNSQAMLITSVIDGLNLVSFEYIASQNKLNPGVLLLSNRTGAYEILKDGTFEIDPNDFDFSCLQLKKAYEMDLEGRRKLFEKIENFGNGDRAKSWAEEFLGKLTNSSYKIK